jgi:hypothetical protein
VPDSSEKKLKKDSPDLKSRLFLDKIDPEATKGVKEGAALLKRGADGIYTKIQNLNWFIESLIIKALAKEEKEIARIYLNSNDSEESQLLPPEGGSLERSRLKAA